MGISGREVKVVVVDGASSYALKSMLEWNGRSEFIRTQNTKIWQHFTALDISSLYLQLALLDLIKTF